MKHFDGQFVWTVRRIVLIKKGVCKHMKKGVRNTRIGAFLFLLAPAFILYTVYFFVPLVMSFWYSLTDYDGIYTMNFIGLKNYVKVLQDRDFYAAMLRTLLYTLVNVPFKVLLPLGTAVLLTSKRLRCRTFFRAGLYIPVLLSSLIVGITINWMFGQEYGLINFMIQKLGGTALEWSMNPVLAETVISIASNWASLGYFMLIFIGAINNVPKELYEAASIDGADRWQSFLHITIPMIAPETFLVLMLSTNDLLKEYAVVQGVTRGGPGSSTTFILQYIYEQGFNSGKNGYASAISVLAMVVFLAIALVQFKFTNGGDDND